jgi:hypothetical protein
MLISTSPLFLKLHLLGVFLQAPPPRSLKPPYAHKPLVSFKPPLFLKLPPSDIYLQAHPPILSSPLMLTSPRFFSITPLWVYTYKSPLQPHSVKPPMLTSTSLRFLSSPHFFPYTTYTHKPPPPTHTHQFSQAPPPFPNPNAHYHKLSAPILFLKSPHPSGAHICSQAPHLPILTIEAPTPTHTHT